MTSAAPDVDRDGQPTEEATVRPLERAQLVWQTARSLSTSERDAERFGTVLDLLRAAHHGPSTMLHALTLGREQQRVNPHDHHTRDAIRLLTRAVEWLGKRTDDNEVGSGSARSAATVRPRNADDGIDPTATAATASTTPAG